MNDGYFLKSCPGPAIANDSDHEEDNDHEDDETDDNEYAVVCGRRMTNYLLFHV